MRPQLTPHQQAAVDALHGDLVVRAGAGSGKTTVLAQRFANGVSVRAEVDGALDSILTITFTNKAAGEIAQRVKTSIGEGALANSNAPTWISTIHSLCSRLIRRHVLESGVDPHFVALDEPSAHVLKTEAFERAASRLYECEAGVERLLDALSPAQARPLVIGIHDSIRARGLDPVEAVLPKPFLKAERFVSEITTQALMLQQALLEARQTASVISKGESLAAWLATFTTCEASSDLAGLTTLCDCYDVKHLSGDAKEINAELRSYLGRLRHILKGTEYLDELQGVASLVRAYAAEYERLKKERAAVDFEDLQHLAVRLLETDAGVAKRYREQFDLIMVDEFQDTNELQMRVLAPLRRNNLCVVGDERQSIYGFRYADVSLFEQATRSADQVVSLDDNFRSHPDLMGFVNALFSQPHLFGGGFMRLSARRQGGWRVDTEGLDARVNCLFVDESSAKRADALRLEAEWIASSIADHMRAGAEPGDIVILLRASTHAAVFAKALEDADVPVLVHAGSALIDTREVAEVLALLRVVAVPTDDRALVDVLAGRLVGVSDDALLRLRSLAGKRAMWDALQDMAHQEAPDGLLEEEWAALRFSYDAILELGERQGRQPLSQFIRTACEQFDFDLTLHALGIDGIRGWSNVLKVARLADAFEAAEGNDLAEFVDYIRRRGALGADPPAPIDISAKAVRIMTIHASKGLEFPIVYVAGLGTPKRTRDSRRALTGIGEHDGRAVPIIGVRLPDEPFGGATTATYYELSDAAKDADVEEEKRCLYVACTRAEEILYLSGCCKLDKPATEGGGLIDWVREGLGDTDSPLLSIEGAPVGVHAIAAQSVDVSNPPDTQTLKLPGRQLVATRVKRHEPVSLPSLPSTVSYSSLHRFGLCPLSHYAHDVLRIEPFGERGKPEALAFGSAVHAALQAVLEGRDEGVRQAAFRWQLTEAARARMNQAVENFTSSDQFASAREADVVKTEEPFAVHLGPTVLIGSIDALLWEGSRVQILDYKTGAAPKPDNARESGYLLQAQCYALAALEAGASDVGVTFCFVEHRGVTLRYDFGAPERESLRGRLRELADRMQDGSIDHLESFDSGICASCVALGSVCPVVVPAQFTKSRR